MFLSVGFSVATHYCGNVIGDVKIVSVVDQSPPESCCEPEKDLTCCETDFDSYKIDDLHQSVISQFSNFFEKDFSTPIEFIQLPQNETNYIYAERNHIYSQANSCIYKFTCAYII